MLDVVLGNLGEVREGASIIIDFDLFGGSVVDLHKTFRDNIGETKEGRAEGSSAMVDLREVHEGCAWINMDFDLFGCSVGALRRSLRDDIGEAKEGRAEGSSVDSPPMMDFDLFGSMDLGVGFRKNFRDDIGETKEGRAEGSSMLVNEGCAF
jgi:hypothetical protein